MTEMEIEQLKLMILDDELDNLDLLYRTFRRDYKVYKANHAHTALKILQQEGEMAVIISDQRMPDMNGTEFLSHIVEQFPDTIRILLTGFTDLEDLVDAINSGKVFKYITKPWNPEKLKALVEQASDTYRAVRQRTQELRRALRRESLFNAVNTAVRESTGYDSMLQKIVNIIGSTFTATSCSLRPIEGDNLMSKEFSYCETKSSVPTQPFNLHPLLEKFLKSPKYQLIQDEDTDDGTPAYYLIVPITYQQHLLAVLTLHHWGHKYPWKEEEIQLITSVAEQAALAISQAKFYQRLEEKQRQIRDELEVARQIQNNLLRQQLPEIKDVKVQACCHPAREVGGDFFEVFVHPKGDLWVAVGDVSGKGVPAALFMASAISVLRRELSQETPPEPNIIMQDLNHALGDDLISNNYFITLVIARYTPSTRELVYANAGHIYPLLWSRQGVGQNQPNYLKVRNVPLGIFPTWQAPVGRMTLAPKDILLLTSDGVTEAVVSHQLYPGEKTLSSTEPTHRSMLHQEGLWQLLQQEIQPLCLSHLLARIQTDNNYIQEDDQTILSLEVL
jgi:serine phosphatase RsbU (regulator of sigma subunit)/FixJ family two-component response regulator